ncbi:xylulokinase [Candidatus Aerophobetes bacterium]|uniref:Xylulokinase n=1 Tax=Aerophobetes bacterium TaxID=2030807 RepID=A0A662DAK4_UNCAE|nr:MAG: xylulokinase [Candidatus Aerophobetes bacterium]
MKKYILVHDIGTTGNKTGIFNEEGKLLASSYHPYQTYYPQPLYVEQSPHEWWKAVCLSTKKVLAKAGVSPSDIACISLSGQMMGAVPVDRDGNLLRDRVWIWADARAKKQAQMILKKLGGMERFYQITALGHIPECNAVFKMVWMKEKEPDLYRKTYKFLQAKDYIVSKLTGVFGTDFSDASNTGLFDIKKRDYSDEILYAAGISREKLPDIHDSIDIAGNITRQAAQETGLKSGIPVAVGGGDVPCAAAGAGVLKEKTCYIYIGSAAWMGIFSPEPLFDFKSMLCSFAHVVPGAYTPHYTAYSGGICYQWFKNICCGIESEAAKKSGVDVYDILNLKAQSIPPGSDGLLFLPYMRSGGAPYHNPNDRGAFIGLSLPHKKEHLIRAIMEGVALNQRIILELFQRQGVKIQQVRVIGGGSKGKIWPQIIADVLNLEVSLISLTQEANSLGAAIIGGVAIGMFKDFSVADKMIEVASRQKSRPQAHQKYEKIYPIFKQAYKSLVPVFDQLAG